MLWKSSPPVPSVSELKPLLFSSESMLYHNTPVNCFTVPLRLGFAGSVPARCGLVGITLIR